MNLKKWLQLSLVNLLIVSLLGVILRYKIAFSLPFIDQKKLLHGHSHFAFSGWVSLALMALTVHRLSAHCGKINFKRYNPVLWVNAICAYGMLISFPIQGYGLFSIFFSTCELLGSYAFMGLVWRDIKSSGATHPLFAWLKAATLFRAVSSIGAFSLAFMMATRNMHQSWYLAAVYFFLHFQYNGWFSFAILGLLFEKLAVNDRIIRSAQLIFVTLAVACVPAYFLSALWMPLPRLLSAVIVLSAFAQMFAWLWTTHIAWKHRKNLKAALGRVPYIIICMSMLAFTIKFSLQLGSTIPSLSTLAFGFRPIVIGYLHLVLLGVVSLFIIGYAMHTGIIHNSIRTTTGLWIFIGGIVLNEAALMIQGFAALSYIIVPFINEILFCIALTMFTGLLLLNFQFRLSRPGLNSVTNKNLVAQ